MLKWLGLLLCWLPFVAVAGSLNIAVASNFSAPAKKLANAFEAQSGHQLKLSFAASGKLYAQIRAGAPFALFLSADQHKPLLLEQQGLTVKGSRQTYAIGRLVLWAREQQAQPLQVLLQSGKYNKLSLANPKVAPYGEAALKVLESLSILDTSRAKWVLGENVAQAYQFVATGNADLGLIAHSQLLLAGSDGKGQFWQIPQHYYPAIKQDLVWLKLAETHPIAESFLTFLDSDQAQWIIRSSGYDLPKQEGR